MSVFRSRVAVTMLSCVMLGAYALPAQAITVQDNYTGADDHGWGDRIGGSTFEISSADITLTDTVLSVSIITNFAGEAGSPGFGSITGGNGIGYGDLFLAGSWTPSGNSGDHYIADDHDSSPTTVWSFGVSIADADRWGNTGGTATLYSLNSGDNDADALLSKDFITGGTFRNGQEVAVDTENGNVTAVTTGTWEVQSDRVVFEIDLSGTSLLNSDTIAFHWGMTCANDVIEGEVTFDSTTVVPLPGALLMMLSGLGVFGLAGLRRSNRA